jgi:hypothetical protein
MRRLLAVVTAAAARPDNATAYFDAAETLWPPTSTAGRCLAQQHKYGWRPKPKGSNFKTLGTEGVGHHLCGNQISDARHRRDASPVRNCIDFHTGHHWLESLPRRLCGGGGKLKRCGGQFSFSSCGGCCYAKAAARLEKAIKNLDCRRTFFLSYDLAALHPQAHAIAFAQFLGVAKVGFFRGANATTDCLTRVKPWLARLRAYAAWTGRPADGGFDGVARACTDGDDRSCAAAWRRRAENGAAALGRKHPTVVPRLLATCA